MAKFEIKPVMRKNNKNLRETEKLLKILSSLIYNGNYIAVEFDGDKPRFTKRWFDTGWHSVDL